MTRSAIERPGASRELLFLIAADPFRSRASNVRIRFEAAISGGLSLNRRARLATHARLLGQRRPGTEDIGLNGSRLPTAAARDWLVLRPSRDRPLGHTEEGGKFEVSPEAKRGADCLFGHLAIVHS